MSVTDTRAKMRRSGAKTPAPAVQAAGHDVLVALRRIIRATDLHSKRLLKISGLTTPQVIVLQSIRDLGEVTTGQISAEVSLSQGTVTSILDRLEKHGLIERYRSLSDRRVVHARLTASGEAVLRKAPPLLHERFMDCFAELSPARQHQIIATLNEVAEMMGAGDLDAAPLLDIGVAPAQGASGTAPPRRR